MFIVTDRQMKLMEKARIQDIAEDTYHLILDEFPELVTIKHEQLHTQVGAYIKTANTKYSLSLFDALQDYVVLCLQYPVLTKDSLPQDLMDVLTWPDMEDEARISEIRKILLSKY